MTAIDNQCSYKEYRSNLKQKQEGIGFDLSNQSVIPHTLDYPYPWQFREKELRSIQYQNNTQMHVCNTQCRVKTNLDSMIGESNDKKLMTALKIPIV